MSFPEVRYLNAHSFTDDAVFTKLTVAIRTTRLLHRTQTISSTSELEVLRSMFLVSGISLWPSGMHFLVAGSKRMPSELGTLPALQLVLSHASTIDGVIPVNKIIYDVSFFIVVFVYLLDLLILALNLRLVFK